MQTYSEISGKIITWFNNNIDNLILAILIFVVGWFLIKFISQIIRRLLKAGKVDEAAFPIILSSIRFVLKIFLIIQVASVLGFNDTSILATLGAMGLGAGFALKDSLSNFASGILILSIKPFIKDDIIETQNLSGVVKKIHIFNTEIVTFENKAVLIPNSNLMNGNIVNTSKNEILRLDVPISIDYNSDLKLAKELAIEYITNHENTIKDRVLNAFVSNIGDNSIDLTIRCFVKVSNLVPTRADIWENLTQKFKDNGIKHPYPYRELHIKSTDTNKSI